MPSLRDAPTWCPPLTRVRVTFPRPRIEDPAAELRRRLDASPARPGSGEAVAIGAGSRGIDHFADLVRATVDWVTSCGAKPFIVPAMGSHGGATAEGQAKVLASYGVDEAGVGAPVRSGMEVVELPQGDLPVPCYFDRHAFGADHTILLNRVKPHTCFHGTYESGLMKMVAIGLGKQEQALALHGLGSRGLRDLMPQVARQTLATSNILLGIGLVENAYDELCRIEVIPAPDIPGRELDLIAEARARMPRLPLDDIDILIVDEMGKNISGVGMDPNIIGRMGVPDLPDAVTPRIGIIYVRDLTEASHGNGLGVGLADLASRRLFEKLDLAATYENLYTSTYMARGKIPALVDDDAQGLVFAVRTCRAPDPERTVLLRIRNTLHIDELWASPEAVRQLQGRDDVEILDTDPEPLGPDRMLKAFDP